MCVIYTYIHIYVYIYMYITYIYGVCGHGLCGTCAAEREEKLTQSEKMCVSVNKAFANVNNRK